VEEHPAALADVLFTPCLEYQGPKRSAGLREIVGAPSLVPAWAEPVDEDTWILRLHEVDGRRGKARVCLLPGWKARSAAPDHSAAGVDFARAGEPEFVAHYRPYEIVSVVISRARS
jgi:alpha-mannosidase